jgi:hypothetical protein
MMDKSFIEAIQKGTATGVVTVDGKQYATRQVYNPPLPDEPEATPLHLGSLSGLAAYCGDLTRDGLNPTELFLVINSATEVTLASKLAGVHRDREHYVSVNAPAFGYPFNSFVSHPVFMISLQTLFQDYGDRAKVMKAIGTMRNEHITTSQDDGITQRVTASTGVVLAGEIALPNPVLLKPFRTFLDIDQPPSNFVLRVQKGKGELPDVGLFEADGGRWKTEAVGNIREYLTEKTTGITILA